MMRHITNYVIIGHKKIGVGKPVFIIAEAGVNYNNKLSLAYKMIDIAAKSGADAIKFQTFKAKSIHLDNSQKPGYQLKFKGKSYFEIIKNLETPYNKQKKIFDYCNQKNIMFLSTPYDIESVDFLCDLNILLLNYLFSEIALMW